VALTLLVAAILALGVIGPQLKRVYPFTYDELTYLRKTRAYDHWLREAAVQARAGNALWVFSRAAVSQAEVLRDMHPGFVKLVGLVPHWLTLLTLHKEGGARLTGALFLALAGASLYWFLAPSTGRPLAFLGALGFGLLPRLFGHAHFHALDIPAMTMIFVAACASRRAATRGTWGAALVGGVLCGIALATKLNAVALLPHLVLWLLLFRPVGWKKMLVSGLVLAPLVFFCLWPWLWHDLPDKLSAYIAFHAQHFKVGTLYLGRVYGGATTAPISYPPVMLAVSVPLAWLALLCVGVKGVARRRDEREAFLWLGLLTNLGLTMLPNAARYGGARLAMPAIIFAAPLALLAAHRLGLRVAQSGLARRAWPSVVGAILVATSLVGIVATYPYCLSYYSPLIGGPRGAQRLGLEITYWGDAFYGAAATMSDPANSAAQFYASNELATGVLDALIRANMVPPQHRLLGRFIEDQIPADADWVIVDNSPPMWSAATAQLVRTRRPDVTVARQGVPLLWLYHLVDE
jgi:hypothetical protein